LHLLLTKKPELNLYEKDVFHTSA